MSRRLFHAGLGASLVVGAALLALWVRSFWRHDYVRVSYVRPGPTIECRDLLIVSSSGGLSVGFRSGRRNDGGVAAGDAPRLYMRHVAHPAGGYPYLDRRQWIEYALDQPGYVNAGMRGAWTGVQQTVVAPHVAWAAAALPLPVVWLARRRGAARRRERVVQGLCASCGYDLRGGGGTCPECGTAATAPGADDRRAAGAYDSPPR